ncbi:hypothetical protein SmJEL517_g00537 [Synchytrium microbalum]|uniref:CP-type G domain-containing protein n=1 Tax=Synchytrium microbalum TaxID=1806994 RepID=A0A507CEC8_9FUNG|nr:uncharacterized protein SmJEL517_g00537 [Synchytrium microbalum]TPX37708.1 hypothetical protein SmJEL517_g00537 [Synchytrium microbalum]
MAGGAKKKKTGLGKALMRSRFSTATHVNPDGSLRHTTDLDDSTISLKSITQETDLDAFLTTAQLAGTEFTAEKLNIQVVSNDYQNPFLLSPEKEAETLNLHAQKRDRLTVPRRPEWDETTTGEELQEAERNSFLEWRRGLAQLEEDEGMLLTPYERNLEVWRQLWRVIERSDLVVQIVDARNPLFFRSTDLEKYVKEGDPRRINLLLVNKADMLTESQRLQWADYFQSHNIRHAFFSAALSKAEQEREAGELQGDDDVDAESSDDEMAERDDSYNRFNMNDAEEIIDDSDDEVADSNDMKLGDNEMENGEVIEDDGEDEYTTESDDDDIPNAKSNIPTKSNQQPTPPPSSSKPASTQSHSSSAYPLGHILSASELLDLFSDEAPEPLRPDMADKVTIGFVGYPNVGKSSTLNALVGAKKVAVASTPGKTKHFQTIHISDSMILCDCPGLVFPSFATTKAEMVINGVLPIDQLREHTAPCTLVTRVIPKRVLESTYGIRIKTLNEEGFPIDRMPTSEEFLKALAAARGYKKAVQGNPDEARAARYVLKDFVNGKLLAVVPPPGCSDLVRFAKETEEVMMLRVKKHRGDDSVTPVSVLSSFDTNGGITSLTGDTTMYSAQPQQNALYSSTFADDSTGGVAAKSTGKFASSNFIRTSLALGNNSGVSKKHNKSSKRQGKRRENYTATFD